MLIHERANVVQPPAGGLQGLLKFELGLRLRLAERHLNAAVRVDLALAGRLDQQEDHVFEMVHHGGLHAVGL